MFHILQIMHSLMRCGILLSLLYITSLQNSDSFCGSLTCYIPSSENLSGNHGTGTTPKPWPLYIHAHSYIYSAFL